MRIFCNYAIVCGLGAALVGTVAGCRLGESLEGYTSGRQQDASDASTEATPGSSGSAGTVGTGGTAQGGGAGAEGGTAPECDASTGKCDEGVYQPCVDGKWGAKENCAYTNQYCSTQKGCVDKCDSNDQCKKHQDAVNGEYCRDDSRCSPKLFETVWYITDATKPLILPYYDDAGKSKCDFKILWGDEAEGVDITKVNPITDCTKAQNRTHTYSSVGKYHVKILGTYNGWGADEKEFETFSSILELLKEVVSFGPVGLTQYAFRNVGDIELPERDIPDASKWTNAKGLFFKAEKFNKPLNHWDVSNVKDMSFMFGYAEAFNQPLDKWDVSSVENMSSMFRGAVKFDNDINSWDVSKVKNMKEMFMSATVFNQPLDKWNVSSVEDTSLTFRGAVKFDNDINGWDVSKVKNMKEMFMSAKAFNQPLDKWNVSSVENMESMFSGAIKFDQDLSAWTLNKNVMLNFIFRNSGMSRYNYCELKKRDIWKEQHLGISYFCPSDS